MNIFLDYMSGVPIYEQLYTKIKEEIMNGTLNEDESLPSLRKLSKELCVSIITIKRAYEELERKGLIYTIASKGCFVAHLNTELLQEESLKEIECHIAEIVRLSACCNLSEQDLYDMIKLHTKSEQ